MFPLSMQQPVILLVFAALRHIQQQLPYMAAPVMITAEAPTVIVRSAFQGRGYGSEAATLLETHLFSSAGIRQIALAVLVQNTPAMAFWEKRGYVREGRYIDTEGDDVYTYVLPRPPSTA